MDVKSFLRIDSGDHVVRTFQGSNSNRRVWRSPPNRGFGLSEGGGRWGVVPASEHQEILVALASLIRAQRYDMALTILEIEITLKQADSTFTARHQAYELTTSQGR